MKSSRQPSRRKPRVLCVSDDPDFLENTRVMLGDVAEMQAEGDIQEALVALQSRPFAGALIDSRTAGPLAVRLTTHYLAHQPAGRVVIACPSADSLTLCNLAARDPRAETVFDPWEGAGELRAILLGPIEMGSFTRRAGPQGRLAGLLKR